MRETKWKKEKFINIIRGFETRKNLLATQNVTDATRSYLFTSTVLSLTFSRQKEMVLKMAASSSA
jgi:hypothetical protein